MSKNWDSNKGGRARWIAWLSEVMAECLRVAKPGAMMLCWSIPRTSHWTGTAIEQAGWEVRDVITHLFGSGMPKGLDISKAIDAAAGVEREVIGSNGYRNPKTTRSMWEKSDPGDPNYDGTTLGVGERLITAPATDAAKEWAGYNVALKPAAEFWWLAMKPIDKNFAHNALAHGVAGLWVDGARIATDELTPRNNKPGFNGWANHSGGYVEPSPLGRWPANLVLDTEAARLLDEMSGERRSSGIYPASYVTPNNNQVYGGNIGNTQGQLYDDHGGASRYFTVIDSEESRFFYSAKASRSERDQGTEDGNGHPCVKPLSLMRHLVKLTRTPKGGSVLDPFCGSGSTGVACMIEGRSFVGIDSDPGSIELSHHRIEHWRDEVSTEPRKIKDTVTHTDLPLFMGLSV